MPGRHTAIFDSGVGGLTVLAALRRADPGRSFLYLGDTARVPYGTKSPAIVTRYALEAAWFLHRYDVEALVVACNTASAVALPALRAAYPDLPVLGVVEPGARAALAATRSGRIAVLGTEGTVASGAYREAIHAHRPDAVVVESACPLFVPLAEEGVTEGPLARLAVERYLEGLLEQDVDTIVLGCTHYPLLRELIADVAGTGVRIVDSAEPLAEELQRRVSPAEEGDASLRLFTTDHPGRFVGIGAPFLGAPIETPTRVDLEGLVVEERQRLGSDDFLYGSDVA